MTLAATNFLAFGDIGDAFGVWVRRFSVKELMAAFAVAEQTAKKWRSGKLPEQRHFAAMVERWGQPFLAAIFAPALARAETDLIGQLESVEVQISVLRERVTHEAKRGAAVRLAAVEVGGGVDLDIPVPPVVGVAAGRSGGNAGAVRASVAAHGWRLAGIVILLAAALHGPLSDVLGDGLFAARAGRGVSAARVVRAGGRGEC